MYRIIFQFSPQVIGNLESTVIPTNPEEIEKIASELSQEPFSCVIEPIFLEPALVLRAEMLSLGQHFCENCSNDFASYYHCFIDSYDAALQLQDYLRQKTEVTYVEIQGELTAPLFIDENRKIEFITQQTAHLSLTPAPTGNFMAIQGYLDPSPDGIDARFAWTQPGGKGTNAKIIDIEYGWNFGHEDLKSRQIGITSGINRNDDHGTAVLGIFSGDDNSFGVTGIAPESIAAAVAAAFDDTRWNAAAAIEIAANSLGAGDVIILEMHAPGPRFNFQLRDDQKGYMPVEYWNDEFAAIQFATSKGIYVVEAAGNGGENLDSPIYNNLFSRSNRDSGAILVGAGASSSQSNARSRLQFSNYGSRLDVQGWGEDVVTTGGRSRSIYFDLVDNPQASRCYTQSFGGTSSAAPIVAGAVALISSIVQAAGDPPLSPAAMRQLLISTGTSQTGNTLEQIGPLPNLKQAIQTL